MSSLVAMGSVGLQVVVESSVDRQDLRLAPRLTCLCERASCTRQLVHHQELRLSVRFVTSPRRHLTRRALPRPQHSGPLRQRELIDTTTPMPYRPRTQQDTVTKARSSRRDLQTLFVRQLLRRQRHATSTRRRDQQRTCHRATTGMTRPMHSPRRAYQRTILH